MKTSISKSGIRHLTPALSPIEAERVTSAACVSRVGFAEMLEVSVRTIDRMIAAKEIPVHRVRGKVVRILRSDAERYLADGNAAGNGEIKNLKTTNQTGEFTPESSKTKRPKQS